MTMDSISLEKTAKGFAISLVGALLAGFILLIPEVNDFIAMDDPIEWRQAALASWGAFASGFVNMVREFVKGQ